MSSMITDETFPIFEWTFGAAAIALTCGRYYIRWHYVRAVKWDDMFQGLALVSLIAYLATYEVDIYTDNPVIAFKTDLAASFLLWSTLYFVKASFLALIRSIFTISARFRKVWWAVVIYTVIGFLATFLSQFWYCGNPSSFANVSVCYEEASLASNQPYVIEACVKLAFHLTSDLLILALPITQIRKLHMPIAKKISVAAVFALSIIDIISGIIRNTLLIRTLSDEPASRDARDLWLYLILLMDVVEPALAVIVCALPAYRAIFPSSRKRRNKSVELRRNAANMGRAIPKRPQSIQISEYIDSDITEPGVAH